MRPGDHIKVSRGGYEHHGIVHSPGHAIHFTDVRPQKSAASVQLTTVEAFAAGGRVEVVRYGRRVTAAVAVGRAELLLGRGAYNLVSNNCEHVATWCCTGSWESEQVIRAGGALATPIAGYVGAAAMSTSVAAVGLVPGTSGPGIMSGLASIGGSAVGGAALAAGVPAAGAALVLHHTVLRDNPHHTAETREERRIARLGATLGVPAAALLGIAALMHAGQPGLGAVGISTGLKALGRAFGGGMIRGLLALGFIGVLAVAATAFVAVKLHRQRKALADLQLPVVKRHTHGTTLRVNN